MIVSAKKIKRTKNALTKKSGLENLRGFIGIIKFTDPASSLILKINDLTKHDKFSGHVMKKVN